jgi:hypothetical protein
VRGDLIALQIGDIVPASCELAEKIDPAIRLIVGDTIKTTLIHDDENFAKLPAGRSTIPKGSNLFLPLCNGMRLYIVTETPLESFLRKPAGACFLARCHLIRNHLTGRFHCSINETIRIVSTTDGNSKTSFCHCPCLLSIDFVYFICATWFRGVRSVTHLNVTIVIGYGYLTSCWSSVFVHL